MTGWCSCTNNLSSILTTTWPFLFSLKHLCIYFTWSLFVTESFRRDKWVDWRMYVHLERLTGNVLLRKENHIIIRRYTCPTHRAWFKIVAINHSNQHLKLHYTSHSRFLFCKTRKWFIKALTQIVFNHCLVFDHMAAKLHLLKSCGLLAKERARLYRTFHQSCFIINAH